MSNKKTLLSLAVAAGLGAVSLQASAAAPTVYGDIAVAFVYTGTAADTGTGSQTGYSFNDNVSILGVKGEAAKIGDISYFYDFNWILDGGSPATHLSTVGMDGSFGTVTLGTRVNGLFAEMVDGGTYQMNWFYTPGMSSLQVSDSIVYKTKSMSGLQVGLQAFDIGKSNVDGGDTTTNYTLAGTYAMGAWTFGLGYSSFADLASSPTTSSGGVSGDTNQLGDAQNTWSGVTLKSTTGVTVGYAADKWGVVAAYDMRKPTDYDSTGATQSTDTIKTLMVTGSYSVSDKTTLAANYSTSKQGSGDSANIVTLIASYAPNDALYYSFEYQSSNDIANQAGVSGSTGPVDSTSTGIKSRNSIALGVTYNF